MTNNVTVLPEAYLNQMNQMLGEEAQAFIDSYRQERTYGLRFQPLKLEQNNELIDTLTSKFSLEPVPWCDEGYYYRPDARPGKHPYHAAGLYYIQEPSAMSAVQLLDPQPGETVLDLAAAPGGKTTHIAGRLRGQGLLIANEIHRERAKILASNVERMGCTNTIVTNSDPDTLAERFPLFFDRIMLDAPCSGEGMFRKDPDAIEEWSTEHVALCVSRQWDIIQAAVQMLKPGGTIAYSTCTFNLDENEHIIQRWLETYPEFNLVHQERIWPHLQRGEGHFVAVLRRSSADDTTSTAQSFVHVTTHSATLPSAHNVKGNRTKSKLRKQPIRKNNQQPHTAAVYEQFQKWAQDHLPNWKPPLSGKPILFGEELYWMPAPSSFTSELCDWLEEKFTGIRMPRPGLHLAHVRKQRIEPAHALALSILDTASVSFAVHLTSSSHAQAITKYLNGEALLLDQDVNMDAHSSMAANGWTLVTIDGLPIGWGKTTDGMVKNHYPKGLRTLHTFE